MSLSERSAGRGMLGAGDPRRAGYRVLSWRPSIGRALAGVVMATALLSGCSDGSGFRPLYATGSLGGGNVTEKLAHVEYAPIPGRVGQRVRNELIFHSTGGGSASSPAYRMEIAVTEGITQTLVKTDGNSLSAVYNLTANFRLVRLSDKKAVLTGSSFARASFERLTSIYSNVRASDDAEARAARTVAEELKSRLSAYLATAT